jgi:hypothetical protein
MQDSTANDPAASQRRPLADALSPVLQRLRADLGRRVVPTVRGADLSNPFQGLLRPLTEGVGRLEPQLAAIGAAQYSDAPAGEMAVGRAVGRLEAALDDIVAGYHTVMALSVDSDASALHALLIGAYRHTLGEVEGVLHRLVHGRAGANVGMLHGGPPTAGTQQGQDGLTLTPAPQLAAVQRWLDSQPRPPSGPSARPMPDAANFVATTAAVVLGVGLADWLFDGDDGSLF